MPWLAGTACVLAVWTSWCPTCQAAMPFWERNAAAFAAQGVRVYAINHRESLATIDTASRDFPAALTVLADPDGALLSTLHSTDLPTTAFVDRRGHVTAVIRGPVSANTAQTLLSALVAPQAETP
jgi:thiol-disulfide isomerase/thioredoxin